MIRQHLSDEEIQEYVLQASLADTDLVEHMRICPVCQLKMDQYKLLFETIKQQEQPAFEFDLAASVIAKLPVPETGRSYPFLIIFIGILSVFTIGWYFGNSLLKLFSNVTPKLIGLIAVTGITLLVFLCIDMYRKYQAQLKSLDFY